MASSKRERASMREGPLSELFRRTEKPGTPPRQDAPEAGDTSLAPAAPAAPAPTPLAQSEPDPEPVTVEQPAAATPAGREGYPHPSLGAEEPPAEPSRQVPTPQERLRSAFSSDLPENILDAGRPRSGCDPPRR